MDSGHGLETSQNFVLEVWGNIAKFAVALDESAEVNAKSQHHDEIKVVSNLSFCLHIGPVGDILLVVSDRSVCLSESGQRTMDTDDIVASAGVGRGCVRAPLQKIYPQ